MRIPALLIGCLLWGTLGSAQDAFFYESNQIRGFINPALTGINGSLSFTTIAKEQFTNNLGDFLSAGISLEQSWPCVKVDGGVFHIVDQEGTGRLRTSHSGLNFVYTLPFEAGNSMNNIRIGTKFQYTNKNINWDRLTFSDQIDAKYNLRDAFGNANQSAFVPPDWNSSSRLTLGLGIIHKVDVGRTNKWSLTWGFAIENYTNAFEDQGYDSILRLEKVKNRLINKWSAYLAPEFPLVSTYQDYFGFRPSLVVLQESSLINIQLGFDTNFRRAYGVGIYLSTGHPEEYNSDAKSLIFNTYLRALTTETSQLNVGLQYIHNIGGFSAQFGQSLQITVGFFFKKDGCSSTPNTKSDCPPISLRKRMMYENIWFSPLEGINK